MRISVVMPVYNEAESILILIDELTEVLGELKLNYEIIAVNDGSKDNSFEILKELAVRNHNIKLINFRTNMGQTAAISAGIDYATGDLIVPIDSDLENDPHDIPKLLTKLDEGYDVVSGWRKNRWQDNYITRKIPSMVANWLISKITKVPLHDYGCILKVYKKEVIQGVNLYGEMHRFIPAYAVWRGAKVAEVTVNQRKRIHGKSNYNLWRTFKVVLDLIVIRFLDKYMNTPIHFFGGIGFVSLAIGLFSGFFAVILRLFHFADLVETPLPVFSALFIIVGVQMIAMGIISEMLMRTYYESQGKKSYAIKDLINLK